MSDKLVELVRDEDYLLRVFTKTKNTTYTNLTKELIKFIGNIYRIIEPSHIDGKVVAFFELTDEIMLVDLVGLNFYDSGILNHNCSSHVFQLFQNGENAIIISKY